MATKLYNQLKNSLNNIGNMRPMTISFHYRFPVVLFRGHHLGEVLCFRSVEWRSVREIILAATHISLAATGCVQ